MVKNAITKIGIALEYFVHGFWSDSENLGGLLCTHKRIVLITQLLVQRVLRIFSVEGETYWTDGVVGEIY